MLLCQFVRLSHLTDRHHMVQFCLLLRRNVLAFNKCQLTRTETAPLVEIFSLNKNCSKINLFGASFYGCCNLEVDFPELNELDTGPYDFISSERNIAENISQWEVV